MPSIVKTSRIIDGNDDDPFASLHSLGWALNGPVNGKKDKSYCNRINVNEEIDLNKQIENYFNKEFEDTSCNVTHSIEDKKWLQSVSSTKKRLPNGHYEFKLPFKEIPDLPNNRAQACAIFKSTMRKLEFNKALDIEYRAFMENMKENDFMEKIPYDEIEGPPGKQWYLTHHGVYHKRKGKIRIVFNCSLPYNGVSLNGKLMQGPDLTNSLVGVLIRFRQNKIAFAADITKMFYQVKVPTEDSNFMRFFWFDENDKIAEYRLKVHVFGATSSPSIANFALQEIAHDSRCSREVQNAILRSFYVDDLLHSVESEEKAIDIINEINLVTASAGFNLKSYVSNCQQVLKHLPRDLLSENMKTIDAKNESSQFGKTLGIDWNPRKDTLSFSVSPFLESEVTKRTILKYIASIYDPLGLISPCIVPGKKIFQESCSLKIDWDQEVVSELKISWYRWTKDILKVNNFEIPRSMKKSPITSVTMHTFADGSETAFGAVTYLRFSDEIDTVETALVFSKSHLTPLSRSTQKTIPRIELNSAKTAVELAEKIQSELDLAVTKHYFYTDSTTVLRYLNNEIKKFQRFVSNRVSFIRSFSNVNDWHYVPSKQNPADIISRGSSVDALLSSELWMSGPEFLSEIPLTLPNQPFVSEITSDDEEVKERKPRVINDKEVKCATAVKKENNSTDKLLLSSSVWYKLKVKVGWMLKLIEILRKAGKPCKRLDVTDLNRAEISIIKYVQSNSYKPLIKTLKQNENISRKEPLKKLNPFLDSQGILRVGGRLSHLPVDFEARHQAILPPASHVTWLLMNEAHQRVGHMGRQAILAHVRTKYWIPHGNALARKVVNSCMICRKNQRSFSKQIMAELPSYRIIGDDPPFTETGVDNFGPFYVVNGRKHEKRYGTVFTCLKSRAIHIEVSHSLSTDSFIHSLRRFISRRGNVKKLHSDNGKNFTAASKQLNEEINLWNNSSVFDWLKQKNIEWRFNPPYASHFGGIWEREIRSIRKVLNALLSEQPMKLNDEELTTLFCEVESILNNRPITPVSNDPTDNEALYTPNHLLSLNYREYFPPGLFKSKDGYMRRRWKQIQYLSDLFWTRWKKEYISLLQQREK